jgi:hypothetical protein
MIGVPPLTSGGLITLIGINFGNISPIQSILVNGITNINITRYRSNPINIKD